MHNGIALVIAWPETLCKQAGSWYDPILKFLFINKNYYYKIGHAAIVLIENETGNCHYFDFGRYHAPYQHGRVRSGVTDHDLEIKSRAIVSENRRLENVEDILMELNANDSCHGTGAIHSAYCSINFEKAIAKANQMQEASPIPYGPFVPKGTNCSRFVKTIALAGKPNFVFQMGLSMPLTLSPTPIGNVRALRNYRKIAAKNHGNENIESFNLIINNVIHEKA